jgi:hypothetical protein
MQAQRATLALLARLLAAAEPLAASQALPLARALGALCQQSAQRVAGPCSQPTWRMAQGLHLGAGPHPLAQLQLLRQLSTAAKGAHRR